MNKKHKTHAPLNPKDFFIGVCPEKNSFFDFTIRIGKIRGTAILQGGLYDYYTGHPFDFSCIQQNESVCSIDHIIPTSKGGPDIWQNLVLTSKKNNSKKGDSMPGWDPYECYYEGGVFGEHALRELPYRDAMSNSDVHRAFYLESLVRDYVNNNLKDTIDAVSLLCLHKRVLFEKSIGKGGHNNPWCLDDAVFRFLQFQKGTRIKFDSQEKKDNFFAAIRYFVISEYDGNGASASMLLARVLRDNEPLLRRFSVHPNIFDMLSNHTLTYLVTSIISVCYDVYSYLADNHEGTEREYYGTQYKIFREHYRLHKIV